MIVKTARDQVVHHTPTCGDVIEILRGRDYPHLNVAIARNIQPTRAHYHKTFDEIYFVLDGTMTLRLYDPATDRASEVHLAANELCVIPRGVHHVIAASSPTNRLCVLTVPRFDADDETLSDRLATATGPDGGPS